jgi:hypothetical protein
MPVGGGPVLGRGALAAGEERPVDRLLPTQRTDARPDRDRGGHQDQQEHDGADPAARGHAGHAVQQPDGLLVEPAQCPLRQARPGVPVDLLGQLLARCLLGRLPTELDRDAHPGPVLGAPVVGVRGATAPPGCETPAARASSMSRASRRMRRST